HTLSRSLGLVETATAVVALSTGGVALFVGAGLYTAFAVFTATALYQRLPIQSCGCFGRDDTPPTRIHLGYNVAAGAALVAVAARGVAPINWSLAPVELVLYLGFAAVGVYASYLLMARLPQLLELARNL
ncbi:MAG TPA: MauE/DoxX family redox-associated membrane protein, partial [Acidimicrobiia bacterium]|nr:MauE/DoxX family redox-associated membrane protein [Acidimicrobiia bacterium]